MPVLGGMVFQQPSMLSVNNFIEYTEEFVKFAVSGKFQSDANLSGAPITRTRFTQSRNTLTHMNLLIFRIWGCLLRMRLGLTYRVSTEKSRKAEDPIAYMENSSDSTKAEIYLEDTAFSTGQMISVDFVKQSEAYEFCATLYDVQ